MPKPLRLIAIAITSILIIGFGYLMINKNSDVPDSTATPSNINEVINQSKTEVSTSDGEYVDYSAETIANTKGVRVLFFHAPWCPQCRQLDESIKAGNIPSNVTIFKVDYDSNQKLRQQYGVTIQTTLVLLDDNGNESKKYVAYEQPDLKVVIENLF